MDFDVIVCMYSCIYHVPSSQTLFVTPLQESSMCSVAFKYSLRRPNRAAQHNSFGEPAGPDPPVRHLPCAKTGVKPKHRLGGEHVALRG